MSHRSASAGYGPGEADTEPTNQRQEDEGNVPPRKKPRLERHVRAENILGQAPKAYGGPWLRSDTKQHQTAPIFSLPPEIMHNIFSRLSHAERKYLAQVCKLWQALIRDPIIYTSLTINKDGPRYFYVELLKALPRLKEVQIIERWDLPVLLRTLRKNNPQVRALKIRGLIPQVFHPRTCRRHNLSELKHFTNLQALSLTDFSLGFRNGSTIFSNLKNLKRLELINNDFDKAFVDVVCSSAMRLEEFVCREIFSNPVWQSKSSYEKFFRKMGSSLTSVKLETAQSFFQLSCLAENCLVLKSLELRLRFRDINEVSLAALGKLRHLESLNLFEVRNVRSSAWCNLLSKPSLSQLKSLGLSYSSFLDESVFKTIGENLKNLESVSISCHNAAETALRHVIKNCPKLKSLTVSLIRSKSTLHDFLLIPKCLPHLRVLTFRPSDLNNHHFLIEKQLKVLAPEIRINHAYNHADFLR